MHYNYYFEVCSLVFLVAIFIAYSTRKKFPVPVFKLFGLICFTVILNVSLDISACLALDYSNIVSYQVVELFNKFYYFTQILISYLLFAYVYFSLGSTLKFRRTYLFASIPSIIMAVIILTNSAHHWIFELVYDENGFLYLNRGVAWFTLFIIAGLNVFSAVVYTLVYRRVMPKKLRFVLLCVIGLTTIATIIQTFIPYHLIAGIAYTLSIVFAIITVNDPDAKVDRISNAFNNDALVEYINNQRIERQRKHYIVVDLESFGMFNKVFGLVASNEMLDTIRRFIESVNRKAYVFKVRSARFVILVRNSTEQVEMVKLIKERFSQPFVIDSYTVKMTIKLFYFVNENTFNNSDSYNDFMRRAEEVINFKDSNYVELDKAFMDRVDRDRKIKEILERNLKNKTGFYMVYQPIYDVNKKQFNHFEALLRLDNNELGYVGPGEFVPIAENTGLASEIDYFVLNETCAFLKRNPQVDILEVNISCAEFFNNPSERFIQTIKKHGVDPKRICLEITETVAVKYPAKTKEFMADLSKYGIQFAMDDFGSGYSNISRFITLPFSLVKLDKTLLETTENMAIFFDSAVHLFKNLNIPIVIEGVETEEQLTLTKTKGIEYVQGYFFSKPLTEDNLLDFLNEQKSNA